MSNSNDEQNNEKEELSEDDLLKIVGAFEHLASSIQGMMGQLANSVGGLAERLNSLETQLHEIEKVQSNYLEKQNQKSEKKTD